MKFQFNLFQVLLGRIVYGSQSYPTTQQRSRFDEGECLSLSGRLVQRPEASRNYRFPSVYIGPPSPAEQLVHLLLDTQIKVCAAPTLFSYKHEYEATGDRPAEIWENRCEVPSSVALHPVIEGSFSVAWQRTIIAVRLAKITNRWRRWWLRAIQLRRIIQTMLPTREM
jgi:hypothetical protein